MARSRTVSPERSVHVFFAARRVRSVICDRSLYRAAKPLTRSQDVDHTAGVGGDIDDIAAVDPRMPTSQPFFTARGDHRRRNHDACVRSYTLTNDASFSRRC